jgi:hypothetical protein
MMGPRESRLWTSRVLENNKKGECFLSKSGGDAKDVLRGKVGSFEPVLLKKKN